MCDAATFCRFLLVGGNLRWCLSQEKGAVEDDVAEADIHSTAECNHSGELLATGDKSGRVVIFQQELEVSRRAVPSLGDRVLLGPKRAVTVPPEQEQAAVPGQVQRLQHVPEPRARVQPPEEPGDRGEDQRMRLASCSPRTVRWLMTAWTASLNTTAFGEDV
uniref:Uncharacterized protein n=1 Tax=Scleropages formosus TaxID=113540 RepID=A0A8C9WM12_SCLFO